MKLKLGFSQLQNDIHYIDKILIMFGIFMFGVATAVSWPALLYLIQKIV